MCREINVSLRYMAVAALCGRLLVLISFKKMTLARMKSSQCVCLLNVVMQDGAQQEAFNKHCNPVSMTVRIIT